MAPSNATFKAIVALELVFFVFMWLDPFLLWNSSFQFHSSNTRGNIYYNAARRRRSAQNMSNYYDKYIPTLPTLLIGGTDGSGTRAIAKTMKTLGVVMKLDDPHTLDVHAPTPSKGWTHMVQHVLNDTHSANYTYDEMNNNATIHLVHVLKHVFWKGVKQHRLALQRRHPLNATGVFVGFKAPAVMLLLPLLQQAMGSPIKFIHVVRDGRDIALSRNQSPVTNFYSFMYPNDTIAWNDTDAIPVLAMRLWNDWNTQVLQWEQQQAHSSSNISSNTTTESPADFDYLLVRTEDFINPATRHETIFRLATFVKSPISNQELCRLSQQVSDLGRSISWQTKNDSISYNDFHPEHHGKTIHERYGKWKRILKHKPKLAALLHQVGADGLAAFGYHPQSRESFSLTSERSTLVQVGNDTRLDCNDTFQQ